MSNSLAIANITATIMEILYAELNMRNPGINVSSKSPGLIESWSSDMVNLFLYDFSFNQGYINEDLPTRDDNNRIINKPRLGINLHYLLSAYSKNTGDLEQIGVLGILADSMITLNSNRIIGKDKIRRTIENHPELSNSNLADQTETISITLDKLPREEITKLWSSFIEAQYRTSVFFTVSVIILDSDIQIDPGRLVQKRQIAVYPLRYPVIERIDPSIVSGENQRISLIGKNLASEGAKIKIDKLEESPEIIRINDENIIVKLPKALGIGIKTVQIIHPVARSNVMPFSLVPKTDKKKYEASVGESLTIGIEPGVTKQERVSILLGSATLPITSYGQPDGNLHKTVSVKIPPEFQVAGRSQLYPLIISVNEVQSLFYVDDDFESTTFNQWVPVVEIFKRGV